MRTNGEIERDAQIVTFLRRCAVALEAIAVALNEIARNEFLEQIQPVDEEAPGHEC